VCVFVCVCVCVCVRARVSQTLVLWPNRADNKLLQDSSYLWTGGAH
jgi:hypothetical protein